MIIWIEETQEITKEDLKRIKKYAKKKDKRIRIDTYQGIVKQTYMEFKDKLNR